MTFARAGAATSTVAVLLVAGCAAGGARTATDEPIVALVSRAWDADPDGTDGMVRMEELISQCMHDAGLEYTAVDYDEPTAAVDPALEPGTRAFAELYGYGVVVRPDAAEPSAESWVDPNATYLGALGDAQQDAYWAALTGSDAVGRLCAVR